jgi:hypothetical protein
MADLVACAVPVELVSEVGWLVSDGGAAVGDVVVDAVGVDRDDCLDPLTVEPAVGWA